MAKTKKKRNASIPATKFVEVWQASKDVEAVAKKLGMNIASAGMRARLFRKRGIPLQKFAPRYNSHTALNIAELKKLAASKAPRSSKKVAAKRVRKAKPKKVAAKKRSHAKKPAVTTATAAT